MSGRLSDTFANTFHITKVARKPLRVEISSLVGRVGNLAKDKEQQAVMERLRAARTMIDKTAKTNDARAASVQAAENLLKPLRTEIAALEKKKTQSADEIISKVEAPTKEDLARAKLLEQEVAKVKLEIQAVFTFDDKKPGVEIQDQPLTRPALLGQAERIALQIRSSRVDDKAQDSINVEIGHLRKALQEADKFIEDARSVVALCDPLMADADEQLLELNKRMGPKTVKSPLSMKRTALYGALHSDGGMIDPAAIQVLVNDLLQELALTGDLDDYALKSGQVIDQEAKGPAAQKIFDDKGLDEKLAELQPLAVLLDSSDYLALLSKKTDTKIRIGKLEANYLDPATLADGLLKEIADAKIKLETQLAALFTQVNGKLAGVRTKIQSLEKTKTAPTLKLDKKQQSVFQADWKAITATMDSIGTMMPASAPVATDRQGIANLTSIKPLIESVETLVDAVTKKNDSAGPDAAVFAGAGKRLAELQKNWKSAGGKKKPLPKYYPDDFKKLSDEYAKFIKILPTAKASDIADGLQKFESAFNPKLKTAKELDDFIEGTLRPTMRNYFILYSVPLPTPKTPNVFGDALDALSAEMAKLPPDKGKLTTLMTAVQSVFGRIKTVEALMVAADASFKLEAPKKAAKKEADKKIKDPLRERLHGLKNQFADAEGAVSAAHGDKNVLKQIERMLEQANLEVDAIKEKEATRSMDRIQNHIDLVLANPKGEVARRRRELPDLYNGWRKICETAGGNLASVKAVVLSYQPTDANAQAKVQDLGKRIDAYGSVFSGSSNGLRPLIGALSDDQQPDQARRNAREEALGIVSDLQRRLQAHPLSALLAASPIPAARAVPGRLLAGLDRLYFTILTSVE
jgi:hypothetical protein